MIKLIFSSTDTLGIGKDNSIPWHLDPKIRKEDLSWFKEQTRGSTVIMGYNTWLSLGERPLPNRRNIVITSKTLTGVEHFHTLESTITKEDCFIIGGATLYNYCLRHKLVDQVIWSRVKGKYDCDTFVDGSELWAIDLQLKLSKLKSTEHFDYFLLTR